MGAVKFEVELPEDLVLALNVERSVLGQRAREWIVLALFQEGVISAGRAGEIIGLSKTGFLQLLDSHGISYLDATLEELEAQMHVALDASRASGAE